MPNDRAFALLLLLPTLMGGQALAAENPAPTAPGAMTIDADRLEMYLDRKMHAVGDAELRQDDKAVFGDRIEYKELDKEVRVTGNARLEQRGLVLQGPDLRLRLDEREGEMREVVFTYTRPPDSVVEPASPYLPGTRIYDPDSTVARVKGTDKPPMNFARGDAKKLVFDGPQKEKLYDARYTSCEVGNNDWYLKAGELEINHQTQTGTARNAVLEFKGLPIFYTPWVDFPFVSRRKSGFLAPNFGTTSKTGFDFSAPYYWNIAPNMDATITPRYMGKRGTQVGGEFRYLTSHFSGVNSVEYLPDDNQTGQTRYYARLLNNFNLENGWTGGVDIERVSDNRYFSDMTTNITSTSRVNLPQNGRVAYDDNTWNFLALVEQYQTLDGISYPYQRLPQLSLKGEKEWDFLTMNTFVQWTQFDRSSLAPAAQTMASDPNATLLTGVTGSRTVINPSVSIPLVRSYGYITPKIGVNYTSYNLNNPGFTLTKDGTVTNSEFQSDSRTVPIFSLDSGMYFDRDFRVGKNSYTQTLEPRIFYVYIPYTDQSRLPIFDTGLADLSMDTLFTENQFTGQDRINDANQVTMAFTSRLIDSRTGIQRLAATVGQRFYFSNRKVGLPGADTVINNSSDIVAAVTARLRTHWNIDAAWQYNTDIDRTTKANLGTRYNPEPGKTLNLGYRFTRDKLEQIDASAEWPIAPQWYALGRWNYSLRENRPIEGLAGLEYDAGCWQGRTVIQRVSTATDKKPNYALFFQLVLGGSTSIGSNPMSLLKRSISGYTNASLIPEDQ
ncbi:MAG: LPS-assembly protein LptD [Methylobacillus sp.]|jgi:LPS-assembly protein|nr:LPS-assembly protein LptD [Methylobacillus sp.]